MLRALYRYITAPLIGYYLIVHNTAHDAKYCSIEEELRGKAGRSKRHRQIMTMFAAVRLVPISLQIVQEDWPKRFTATLNQRIGEMGFENTETLVFEFRNWLDIYTPPGFCGLRDGDMAGVSCVSGTR
jgi:hypothetical protein